MTNYKKVIAISLITICLLLASCGHAAIKDGLYKPSSFSWSGGSGRVELTCGEVRISGGEAVAEITFSSPNYEYVRVTEDHISGVYTEDTSTFLVPVKLDQDTEIIGCTSAMSTPHEITYTLHISLNEEGVTAGDHQGSLKLQETVAVVTGAESKNDNTSAKVASDEAQGIVGQDDAAELRARVMQDVNDNNDDFSDIPSIPGLVYDHAMELDYARCFSVNYFEDGYKLIKVIDGSSYLIVPEGDPVPQGLSEDITVIMQPVDNIYLAATSAMSLFNVIDGLDNIKYTGTDVSGWDIDAPVEALRSGKMAFAGKYNAPDYEMLVNGGCDLAIESTMILHNPETREQLTSLGIPVFTDWSSYEMTALGRAEWSRLYAAMINEESEAETFLQKEIVQSGADSGFPATDKRVVFFYINKKGLAVVRNPQDYITGMIRDGGGIYAFDDLTGDINGTTSEISMEEFYSTAVDADYLIYNGTIDSTVTTVQDIVDKNQVLADFKAVMDGHVYMIDKKFYQSTDIASELSRDVSLMLSDSDEEMTFLTRLR